MAKKRTNKEFVEEIRKLVSVEYTFLEEYVNAHTKILCRHNFCGHEWKVKPNNFIRGSRCPRCYKNDNKINTENIKEVEPIKEDDYSFSKEYNSVHNKFQSSNVLI